MIQGSPGSGKSSLGVQLVAHCTRVHGSKAYIFAPDEGTRAACVRLGQAAGIPRDILEAGRPEALRLLEEAYPPGTINLVDADAPEAVLETFLDQIAEERRPNDPPPIFYADSIQTLRTDLDDSFEGKRFQVAYIMETILAASRALAMPVILISHVNRPAFAAKREEDRIDPLAAAAEAAEITRVTDALLDLSGDIHAPEGVRAWLRKNRLHLGKKAKTRLRYDIPKGNFIEMDQDELEKYSTEQKDDKARAASEAREKARQKKAENRRDRIERLVGRRPWKMTKNGIFKEIGGAREAILELVDNLADPSGVHTIHLDDASGTYGPRPPWSPGQEPPTQKGRLNLS